MYENSSESQQDCQTPLPRVQNNPGLSILRQKGRSPQKSRSRYSVSFARSEENASESSQVLYMATPKTSNYRRQDGHSLSEVSNGTGREFDGPAEGKPMLEEKVDTEEALWTIIDREIYEWQYVCETGHPYWWSPEARYTRMRKLAPRSVNDPIIRFWTKQQIEEKPSIEYAERRRAVTDNFLADPTFLNDVAELIAVQLLGACFTLPPDNSIGVPSPNYEGLAKKGSQTLPHPKMISSLRMHTYFRYSPGSGDQARSTSPVQAWPSYDGQCPTPSPPPRAISSPIPNRTLSMFPRVPRFQDRLHLHIPGEPGARSYHELDSSRDEEKEADYTRSSPPESGSRSLNRGNRKRCRPTGTPRGSTEDIPQISSSMRQKSSKSNYRFQSIIRSEPHHVFTQPVKELVVKRWKKFRRILGGSLHGALRSSRASEVGSSASELSSSAASSPSANMDGRTRRRNAQERGDINCSSDSNPHYNSPISDAPTPAVSDNRPLKDDNPFWADAKASTPKHKHSDPLAPVAVLAAADSRILDNATKLHPPLEVLDSDSDSSAIVDFAYHKYRGDSISSMALATCGTSHSKCDFPLFLTPKAVTRVNSPTKRIGRDRRKSMLSEMCTPDDFPNPVTTIEDHSSHSGGGIIDRNLLSIVGSRLASPIEELSPPTLGGKMSLSNGEPSLLTQPPISSSGGGMQAGSEELDSRPKLSRMSSNGTQIFTTGSEGVEVDGIPAGPGKEAWSVKGKEKERSYL